MVFALYSKVLFAFSPAGNGGKVHLKVTKDENGKTSVYEKTYENMESLRADADLKKFDVMVDDWAQNEGANRSVNIDADSGKQVVIMKKSHDGPMTGEQKSNNSGVGFDIMILKNVDGKETKIITEEKIVTVSPEGEKEITVTVDGDGGEEMMITTPGAETVIMEVEGIEGEPMAMGDFSGEKAMILRSMDKDISPGQTINVNVEEKNGEKFIDINIKRENAKKLTISAVDPKDADMKKAGISTKSNLIPTEISYSPNPGNGRFTLKLTLEQKEPVVIRVLDSLGKEVFNESVADFSGSLEKRINLQEKEKGTYVLQISQQKKTLTRKIVIE